MNEYDDVYHMTRVPKTEPFPHTEVTTTQDTNEDTDVLADDLLNWLAWEFVDPAAWHWVFRGVKNCDYRLKSSLDRRLDSRPGVGQQPAEDYLLSQFKKAAHHFIEGSIVRDEARLEWLALMQHYGAPTRFLDFTRSPYVACFFAVEEVEPNQHCAIWAVDTDWLIRNGHRHVCDRLSECSEHRLRDSSFMGKNFDALFVNNRVRLVLPIMPPRSNPRLLAQQGLFLCPSVAEAGFEKNLSGCSEDTTDMAGHVLKIIVDGRIRKGLMSEFRLMNISRATLFPDLQGYAQSLAHELVYRSADEINRLR